MVGWVGGSCSDLVLTNRQAEDLLQQLLTKRAFARLGSPKELTVGLNQTASLPASRVKAMLSETISGAAAIKRHSFFAKKLEGPVTSLVPFPDLTLCKLVPFPDSTLCKLVPFPALTFCKLVPFPGLMLCKLTGSSAYANDVVCARRSPDADVPAEGIDWGKLLHSKAAFVPILDGDMDTSFVEFGAEWNSCLSNTHVAIVLLFYFHI
jgi:hypothetical protein